MQCLDIVSFLVEALRKADEWGEKWFVVSMDVASAFDSVSAEVLGNVLLERGATVTTGAAVVRENLDLSARPCMGFTKSPPFNLRSGNETRRPQNSLWMEPGDFSVGGGTVAVVGQQGASCVLGSGMESVRNVDLGGQHFPSFEFHHRHCAEDTRH